MSVTSVKTDSKPKEKKMSTVTKSEVVTKPVVVAPVETSEAVKLSNGATAVRFSKLPPITHRSTAPLLLPFNELQPGLMVKIDNEAVGKDKKVRQRYANAIVLANKRLEDESVKNPNAPKMHFLMRNDELGTPHLYCLEGFKVHRKRQPK